jgi:hypothetical protein
MFNFLHSLPSDFEFVRGCLVCLLDELVQEDNSPANECAIERPRDALCGFHAKFE